MRLLLDVDGILADWMSVVLQVIKDISDRDIDPCTVNGWLQIHKLGLSKEELSYVENVLQSPDFCATLPLIPGAQEGVQAVYKLGVPITFVTSPWTSNPTWEWERRQWLRKNGFWHTSLTGIVSTDQKFLVSGNMFVDDHPKHVSQWQMNNRGPAFLWTTPWNQQVAHAPRLETWEQLLKEVKKTGGLT